MGGDEAEQQSAWLTMGEALTSLRKAGRHPEEAAAILFRVLAEGSLLGRAEYILVDSSDGATEYRDHIVPAGVLALGPIPPLGHDFWIKGDVRVCPAPVPDGAVVTIGGRTFDAPLGCLLPIFTIRGLRVPRDGVDAICRSLRPPKNMGRRQGVGGFAKDDQPLIVEMHRLLTEGTAGSVHAAAVAVASRAKGGSQVESKVKRLIGRYGTTYPSA